MRERAIERLKRHDIKPSEQRIVIMQYLLTHHNHPTADTIYSELASDDTAAEPGASYHNSRSEQNGIQFVIEETEINYRGLCGDCLQKE